MDSSGIDELDILWLTAALGCDGDSVAMTAATQPSLEDVVLGAIPHLPAVTLHNPLLAYEAGDAFLEPFRRAAEGRATTPFILVVEGSMPDETLAGEGYWAAMGTDGPGGRAIPTCEPRPCTKAATAAGTTSRPISPWSTGRRSAS